MNLKRNTGNTKRPPAETVGANGLVILTSGFDFTEGGFGKAERTRRILLLAVLLSAIGLTALVGIGVMNTSAAGAFTASADSSTQQRTVDAAELAVLDAAGGFTAAELRIHVTAREAAKQAASATQADHLRIANSVLAAAPPGAQVTNLDIQWDVPGDASASAPATVADGGAAAGPTRTISIVAISDSFRQIDVFDRNLTVIPGLEQTAITWSGGGDSWTVDVTGDLSPAAKGPTK